MNIGTMTTAEAVTAIREWDAKAKRYTKLTGDTAVEWQRMPKGAARDEKGALMGQYRRLADDAWMKMDMIARYHEDAYAIVAAEQ